jgi:hypothetical protein
MVKSEHVITSLKRQLSDAHLRIAVLEAQLMEVGAAQPEQEQMLVVPADETGLGQDRVV